MVQHKLIDTSISNAYHLSILTMLKETSFDLWHLTELINNRFAYEMLLSVVTKLAVFVIDIYWVYIRILHAVFNYHFIRIISCLYHYVAASLLCVHPLVSLIGIFYSCNKAVNEYKNISFALHQTSTYNIKSDFHFKKVQKFSLQLMSLKLQFTVKGFFEVTNRTLQEKRF
ncbi:CLUMA_CG018522, isoform A [Clunio marinus]|uniref:CLUMA_CG018522, isoform A n=1 Tax=Clunio marinus TaxID=568069 RepID=A0A1J1IYU5_9DIPT|nr:CLUMA_CG018522, isoform A [Clunio marinus]